MIEIGKFNQLKILRQTSVGLFLGDETGEEVLLPRKYCPDKFSIGGTLNVFAYRDHEERKIVTTLKPGILLHEFALLKANAVDSVGAFMAWGLEKDLLVPFKEQRQRMVAGHWYVVFMDIDNQTDRLFGTNKIEKKLHNEVLLVKEGMEVDLLIYHKTAMGYSVIINNIHKGLVYENEVFKQLNIGETMKGFIKKIREGNKIDVSLRPQGYGKNINGNSESIYQKLVENDGFLAFGDKSSPEKIYKKFGISKKEFKKAIGALYKSRKITLEPDKIKLI